MDPILQTLLSWQFIIFGVAVAAAVFVIRRFVEYGLENWTSMSKKSKLWEELILPILPVMLGAFGALLFKSYPYPDGLTTGASRFIFGLVAGLLSTLLYRVIKALFIQKIQSAATTILPNITTTNIATPENSTPDNPSADSPEENANLINQVRQTINKQ